MRIYEVTCFVQVAADDEEAAAEVVRDALATQFGGDCGVTALDPMAEVTS